MSKQMVKKRYCDRCPLNKQRPATVTRTFGFDQTFWKADLCEQHDDMLTRELYAWGMLGEPIEEAPTAPVRRVTFGRDAEELRRLADLRHRQTQEDRAITTAPPITLPLDHGDWHFTEHALERMEEREVDVVDILWACSSPTLRRPGDDHGVFIHERNGTKVVCNPTTKDILTVADARTDDRKAVGL